MFFVFCLFDKPGTIQSFYYCLFFDDIPTDVLNALFVSELYFVKGPQRCLGLYI